MSTMAFIGMVDDNGDYRGRMIASNGRPIRMRKVLTELNTRWTGGLTGLMHTLIEENYFWGTLDHEQTAEHSLPLYQRTYQAVVGVGAALPVYNREGVPEEWVRGNRYTGYADEACEEPDWGYLLTPAGNEIVIVDDEGMEVASWIL